MGVSHAEFEVCTTVLHEHKFSNLMNSALHSALQQRVYLGQKAIRQIASASAEISFSVPQWVLPFETEGELLWAVQHGSVDHQAAKALEVMMLASNGHIKCERLFNVQHKTCKNLPVRPVSRHHSLHQSDARS